MLVNLLASIISSVLCKTAIYTKYSTLPRVISVYIALKVGIFPRGRRPREIFSTEGAIYAGISQGRVEYLVYYIGSFHKEGSLW